MLPTRTVALAFVPFVLAFAALDADARPRVRPNHVWEREPELIGYRVSVEPVLRYYKCGRGERCPGGDVVATDVVIWKLRTVLRAPSGEEIEGRFTERGRDTIVKDREVRADRWWRSGDLPASTRVLRDPDVALRAFFDWSRSDDPRTLDPRLGDRPDRPEPVPPHPGRPDRYGACEQALLDRGHAPSHLDKCRGLDDQCAVAVLERGFSPSELQHCRNVELSCALDLLQRGFAPNQFAHCRADLSPGCAREVLRRGFSPNQLEHCARVDDRCALEVLSRGHHPNQLNGCRR